MAEPEIIRVGIVASTQDLARRLAREGAPPWTAIVAEGQTGGRGRLGRGWHSPPGRGLYLSVVLPSMPAPALANLGMAAALAVRQSIVSELPVAAGALRIKWPNDVVTTSGQKVAGVLVEAESGARPTAVLGVGINLTHGPDDLPPELRPRATSLALLFGRACAPEVLATSVPRLVAQWWARLVSGGFGPVREALLRDCYPPLGSSIVVEDGRERWEGTFRGLDDDGALLLDGREGSRAFHAGDVTLRSLR